MAINIMNYSKNQTGAALITSLIFLTILTLLGVSSMQSSTLQEKMAGNMQLTNQSFSYAEVGATNVLEAFQGDGSVVLNRSVDEANCVPATRNTMDSTDNEYTTCTWYVADSEANVTEAKLANSAKSDSPLTRMVFALDATGAAKKAGNTLSTASVQRGVYRLGLKAE